MFEFQTLPEGLPIPADDGAATHLPGAVVPELVPTASDGQAIDLRKLGFGRTIIYVYPLTRRPGVDVPEGWGCDSRSARMHDRSVRASRPLRRTVRRWRGCRVRALESRTSLSSGGCFATSAAVYDAVRPSVALGDALSLPTFTAPGEGRLYGRLTMVVRDGSIEHVFHPIFPPNTHPQQVLARVTGNYRRGAERS